ncbi:unnamed protein product [Rotaria sp. Silwood1]|nr:unnamed protein product [Rotaria sp. Silwood1]CAF1171726.1 unnamed protein product [Rotaria sp. Silwood1]CAF3470419.1 unnamed protein product [Rotaria sp. Silwood1]CAF4500197.1 unnamed protein product [Rotaria sp. Silwood1]
MAQVRRQSTNPSPTPRKIPPVPDAVRFRAPTSRSTRQTRSFHVNGQPPHPGSPMRAVHSKQIVNHSPPRIAQTTSEIGEFHNSNNSKYDPSTGLNINFNAINENHEKSYIISASFNSLIPRERQLLLSAPPPSPSESLYLLQQKKRQQQRSNNNDVCTEESVVIPTLSDDDGLPVVSVDKNRVPVYARFPFDVSFLPRPMDTNVEDNIHKLRLRLIDSELEHQRRSTDDYIKRTRTYFILVCIYKKKERKQFILTTKEKLFSEEQLFLSSSKSPEHYLHDISSSNNIIFQRVKPKILSRQTSYSPLSIEIPVPIGNFSRLSRDRIGMENNPQDHSDIERDLEIRRIQESLNSGRQSNQPLMISNYSYDPRLHLQPLNNTLEERQYSSSNMDDLIDSMARRHLAYRRLDAAISRQRQSPGGYNPYFDTSGVRRQASFRSQQRDDDIFFTNTESTSHIGQDFIRANSNSLNQRLRSGVDYYNRIQPDLDDLSSNNMIRTNSYSKLPPISPGIDSNRLSRTQNLSNSALYQAKHNSQGHRNYQQRLNFPDHTEHLIELPSDIFLSSRTESDVSVDSEVDQSDGENNSSIVNHQHSQNKQKSAKKSAKKSANGHHGFFTEGNPPQQQELKKNKFHRRLFQKAAIGILFINILKHGAAKSRLNRPSQTLSATIHKIRLQEIMVALHRVYLEPDGPIYTALIQAVSSSIELKDALDTSSKYYSEAINVIGQALKNVISKIVDFMPKDGVLGTAKNSAISTLIQDGNPFPDNYFWKCEKDILEFNKSKIINVTKQRATLLLIGIFIFRALVTTLLIKPIKYRFMLGELTTNQAASLKVLASVILYVGRRAVKSIPQILTLPHEWESSLYSDTDIEPIIQQAEIKSIITTCELTLRVWCEEYIRRIDASLGKELRT